MSKLLSSLIQKQINNTYANDFQKFVEVLFVAYYGQNFTPIKPKRDKGCDGIINDSKTIIAVYGPEKRDLRAFKRKIKDDFDSFVTHWSKNYPNWQVVYNLTFTADEVQFVDSLNIKIIKQGPEHLLEIFDKLRWKQRRELAKHLGIDDAFYTNDLLETILEDLIQSSEIEENDIPDSRPLYIEDKIALNYSPQEIDAAIEEYEDCLLYFGTLKKLLSGFSDKEQAILRARIRQDYNRTNGEFSQRLEFLTDHYSMKYKNDDEYMFFIRIILIYFFERCFIGRKSKMEKS
ncbi:MAG: hypothetical protein H6654_10275 [Ardenticatenaceae bacterium]|nr:hypothetical protein [Ardenticatenaceae bacterium]MCB8973933.1 hypothetical protein [Ardenticatenaceae bacterium]